MAGRSKPFPDVPEAVRQRMSKIRKTDTKPELVVRSLAHGLGIRFRLHRSDLPGTPDLVFPSRRKIIFVHGCFWHRHGCHLTAKVPSTRADYWAPKLERNVLRDRANKRALNEAGWRVLTVWECEVRHCDQLAAKMQAFLNDKLSNDGMETAASAPSPVCRQVGRK